MIDQDFWPTPNLFLSLANATKIVDNRARCTGVAMCDSEGQPTNLFQQGQTAHFFYEFEILEPLEAPAGGLEFHDSTNFVIHGKNSFQHGPPPQPVVAGQRLRYHHMINLDVRPGQYWFTVGLASTNMADYEQYRAGNIGHSELNDVTVEHCRIINVSPFVVELEPPGKLLHHGVANLPSDCVVTIAQGPFEPVPALQSTESMVQGGFPVALSQGTQSQVQTGFKPVPPAQGTQHVASDAPTIFHVTHWKAGSQWVYRILRACLRDQIVRPQSRMEQFLYWPLQQGKIYPTLYLTKQQFDRVSLPENSHYFVVIRDLRDTLVSAYFSMKVSHPMMGQDLDPLRRTLQSLSTQDGLLFMLNNWLPASANVQLTWAEAGESLIRYEDLLENDLEILEPLLLDTCQLPVSREQFRETVIAHRFKNITKGRERGDEDINAHERKGIAGDWQNHFTEQIKQAFKIRYGGLLVATGYEQDLTW